MYKLKNKRLLKKCDSVTYRLADLLTYLLTYLLTDKVIHRI